MVEAHDVSLYVQETVPIPPFYIQDLLAQEGTILLYGAPGVRKSWLVQYMSFCIATGSDWLGFPTRQARLTLINFEIPSFSYHDRLRLMSRNFQLEEQMLYELSPSILYLEDEHNFRRLQEMVRPTAPNIIVLDCLGGCFGGDENSSQQMALFIGRVTELKQEHHAAIIIVHHSNKNILAVSAMDRARGHTRLTGWVDTILYMVRQPTSVQLQFGKTRLSTRGEFSAINIQFQDYNWTRRVPHGTDITT